MLRLTPGDLAAALAGLSLEDRQQLLRLLQQREALEADQPQDDRVPIGDYVEQVRQEAARVADPAAWLEADAKHAAAADRHMQKLLANAAQAAARYTT